MSNHLSADPAKLSKIYDRMIDVMDGVSNRTMPVEDGETIAKAGHVACKTVEIDLHARVFSHKLAVGPQPAVIRLADRSGKKKSKKAA